MTKGYGHLISPNAPTRAGMPAPLSESAAEAQLSPDVEGKVQYINDRFTASPPPNALSQDQFDGLVDYCFNDGCGSTTGTLSQISDGQNPAYILSGKNVRRLIYDFAAVTGQALPTDYDTGSPCYDLNLSCDRAHFDQCTARSGVCTADGASACDGLQNCEVLRGRCPSGAVSVLCVSKILIAIRMSTFEALLALKGSTDEVHLNSH